MIINNLGAFLPENIVKLPMLLPIDKGSKEF